MDTISVAAARTKPFIVVRNTHVVPKQRRVERFPWGYSVQEACHASEGDYWVVVTALEVA